MTQVFSDEAVALVWFAPHDAPTPDGFHALPVCYRSAGMAVLDDATRIDRGTDLRIRLTEVRPAVASLRRGDRVALVIDAVIADRRYRHHLTATIGAALTGSFLHADVDGPVATVAVDLDEPYRWKDVDLDEAVDRLLNRANAK